MEFHTLRKLVEDKKYSLSQIQKETGKGKTTIRYWLKKHELKLARGARGKHPKDLNLPRKCKCGETDPNKFYGNKRSICGKCHNEYNHNKAKEKRKQIIKEMGGKYVNCGYKKFTCSLDTHHMDPNEKDPNFKTIRYWSIEKIRKECLTKCVLLCKNCHAAVHAGEINLK